MIDRTREDALHFSARADADFQNAITYRRIAVFQRRGRPVPTGRSGSISAQPARKPCPSTVTAISTDDVRQRRLHSASRGGK